MIQILKLKKVMKSYIEVFRFGVVGIFNTLHHQIWYLLMLNFVHYTIANSIGFIMSYLGSFLLHTYFTYKSRPTIIKFILFPLTYLPLLLFSSVGIILAVEWIGIDVKLASFFASIAAIPFSFIISKFVIKSSNW